MKACVQVVNCSTLFARESTNESFREISSISKGFLILFCAEKGDSLEKVSKLAEKILKLRIFNDSNDKMNLSLQDIKAEILAVSQFTLSADPMLSGNRPSFSNSMTYTEAKKFYDFFVSKLKEKMENVKTGVFGSEMKISAELIGPCTINFNL